MGILGRCMTSTPPSSNEPPADAGFEPEALLKHGRFVKALARELARDEDEADELVARTFAAALEQRPTTGPGLRVWLRRVVGRLSARSRRDETRRRRRENEASTREATSATIDVAARIELEQQIATAFANLEEPYRTVLFFRYFDDLAPRVIAERMHTPIETVRTRMKRGLTRLRTALDAQHRQRRDGWRAVAIAFATEGSGTVVATKVKLALAAGVILLEIGRAHV